MYEHSALRVLPGSSWFLSFVGKNRKISQSIWIYPAPANSEHLKEGTVVLINHHAQNKNVVTQTCGSVLAGLTPAILVARGVKHSGNTRRKLTKTSLFC